MKSLYIAYFLGGVCMAVTLGFFAYIDIVPSSLRISTISETAAADASETTGSGAAPKASTTTSAAEKPAVFPEGIVSINFDDGWKTAYTTGFPILQEAQLPATFYIVSHYLGDSAYMSASDVLALQTAGEEIGDHTRDHPNLTKLSTEQMQDEIAGSMADLKADGVRSITTFAYPYGAYNAQTDAIIKQTGYAAARTINNGADSPRSNQYLLLAREVTTHTSVAEVEQWTAAAVARKQWLILVFHQINTDTVPNDPYSWPTADFQTLVDYLTANHIDVMTNAAVIDTYYSGSR